jgi:hypothetical protein
MAAEGVPANAAWLVSTGAKVIDGIRRRARFVSVEDVAGSRGGGRRSQPPGTKRASRMTRRGSSSSAAILSPDAQWR